MGPQRLSEILLQSTFRLLASLCPNFPYKMEIAQLSLVKLEAISMCRIFITSDFSRYCLLQGPSETQFGVNTTSAHAEKTYCTPREYNRGGGAFVGCPVAHISVT